MSLPAGAGRDLLPLALDLPPSDESRRWYAAPDGVDQGVAEAGIVGLPA